ncbi:PTPLA-domain-containing protein [Tilletiaria anomala UBC 951]|uniref:Very-long-chain (3R)-3-hydroxyacyl-CoA dehydratase n=1 Tax=Tilletiaria anomala (strain ATCC 24038 / CBS 436.72 / UBC 951) TaxID=1037660 RepID=A0A066VMY0_TILAU|nr:PTPLA-domain-containing protein [Tilletiaria anomala UBC 951]KDN39910.1 PTPLA-domain-containing protein [Tilletiaria anomala UBC 951]
MAVKMPPKGSSASGVKSKLASGETKPKSPSVAIQLYLIAYNLVSFFLWTVILATLVKHLLLGPQNSSYILHRISSFMEVFRPHRTYLIQKYSSLPAPLRSLLVKASTTHSHMGGLVAFVQTLAVLEVAHAALGWVRSPVPTTAIQVASRLWSVWAVTERFDAAATTPFYASMIFAWSFTEVVRYAFYANQLMDHVPRPLLWARYTTFYLLYPLGAGSEAACMFATLPKSLPWNDKLGQWGFREYIFLFLFTTWWPGLYIMYTHMMKQRRRAIGKGFWGDGSPIDAVKKSK